MKRFRYRLFKVYSSPAIRTELARVFASGYTGQGPQVERFQSLLSWSWGRASGWDALAVNSGTSALDLAYHLAGVTQGARVLTTPLTCTATNLPLLHRGAAIEWYDCDPLTGCASLDDVLRRANAPDRSPPLAIVLVSWGGRNLDPLVTALRQGLHHSAKIVVDYAHAAPLRPPLLADYTCYSFQSIKHLSTGDGGALVCADPAETSRARLLRWYGLDRTKGNSFRCAQRITEAGYKYHMNDVAAAIGIANIMGDFGFEHRARLHLENARSLDHYVGEFPWLRKPAFDDTGAYWIFPVLADTRRDRDQLLNYLEIGATEAGRVHARNDEHPVFEAFRQPDDALPGVKEFDDCHFSLPCGWWLSESGPWGIRCSLRAAYEWYQKDKRKCLAVAKS